MKKLLILLISFYSLSNCSINKNLDDYLGELENEKKAMGTVSIFKDGEQIYNKSIGLANMEESKKANEATLYRIGSISKTFTAAIILQLVEEGKLPLETKLKDYFPKVDQADQITIADLLYHRSGLYNITRSADFEVWISEPRSRTEILDKIYENTSIFESDTKMEYSNTNYILLAFIAEDIDNQNFAEILKNRIVDPLGLEHTFFGKDLDLSKNEAMCYYPENEMWHPITFHTNLTGTMGAGGITSTAKDVNTFYNALFTGELISEEILEQMTTPKGGMGMGISVDRRRGLVVYGHDGRIDGFRSVAAYFPEEKLSIACTFNASQVSSSKTLFQLLDAYFYTVKEQEKG
ncbi:MAG: serine hydrolase domain-containing protein [Bacteroidota bacterium]